MGGYPDGDIEVDGEIVLQTSLVCMQRCECELCYIYVVIPLVCVQNGLGVRVQQSRTPEGIILEQLKNSSKADYTHMLV